MNSGPPAYALAACLLLAGFLSYRCWTPPNPAPPAPYAKDRIGKWVLHNSFLDARRGTAIALWFSYAALALMYPHPPQLLCPYPQNLSPTHFTWSPYVVVCLGLIFVAAPIRLLAFKQLGSNFTFQLAKPKALVTTGLYAYVQHPSYVTLMIINLVNVVMHLAPGGLAGCWLPSAIVAWNGGMGVVVALLVGIDVWGMMVRVRDEEEMLRMEFGKEWGVYHAKTKRFVPGLF
jgi:protein-S-isoprenylcysteine O-methyltransferase Ste14